MSYTLDQFAADCRTALLKDPGPGGRELVRQYTARACADPDFVAEHLGANLQAERKILYEDPTKARRIARRTITDPAGRFMAKPLVQPK